MSIYLHDPDLIDKIASVEGPAWKRLQDVALQTGRIGYSVHGALAKWSRHYKDLEADMEDFAATIYGDGGWNRYHVRPSGKVVFSRFHGMPHKIPVAIAAGFDVE